MGQPSTIPAVQVTYHKNIFSVGHFHISLGLNKSYIEQILSRVSMHFTPKI
jgi:hypothetical protein